MITLKDIDLLKVMSVRSIHMILLTRTDLFIMCYKTRCFIRYN